MPEPASTSVEVVFGVRRGLDDFDVEVFELDVHRRLLATGERRPSLYSNYIDSIFSAGSAAGPWSPKLGGFTALLMLRVVVLGREDDGPGVAHVLPDRADGQPHILVGARRVAIELVDQVLAFFAGEADPDGPDAVVAFNEARLGDGAAPRQEAVERAQPQGLLAVGAPDPGFVRAGRDRIAVLGARHRRLLSCV